MKRLLKRLRDKIKFIIRFIAYHLSQKDFIILGVFLLIFFITRLYNILQIPVFVDEGNYIVWAKQAILNKAYFITLTDGKPPIPTWNAMSFIYFTRENMLLGLRWSSVFGGLLAIVGFFILSYQLFNKRTAFISTFLYLLTPFILFYDRLGVVDSLANATCIFVLITSIILVKKRTIWSAILFGIACGIGLLVKSNIWIPIYASFFAPILVYKRTMRLRFFLKIIIQYSVFYLAAVCIAQLLFSIQLLAPYPNAAELISNKNSDFLYNYHEIAANPLGLFWKNVPERIADLIQMTGWISFFLALAGFIHLFLKRKLESVYLFIWYSAPLFAVTYLVKYYAARYMVFIATLTILMAGYILSSIKHKATALIVGLLMLSTFVYLDYPILFDYQKLNFPRFEREQYVEGIASGYGMKEIVAFIQNEAKNRPVLIVGEGIFGLGAYMVESAFPMNPNNIEITGLWPFTKEGLETYKPHLKNKKVYVVLNNQVELSEKTGKKVPADWPLKLIKNYKKSYNDEYFSLYELTK